MKADSSETAPAWRLLCTPPARGAWNMAVDEAILQGVAQGASPPTLRLYAWEPPCLSLGYAQSVADVDRDALAARGWDLVRRPTGGRAILHTDELTYAVIAPANHPLVAGGVLESYRRLAAALLDALRRLGIPATMQGEAAAPGSGPVCFEVPSSYEITVHGKKLIGSAQARKHGGVLQHGSLPLGGDLTRITQALRFPDAAARAQAADRLLDHATTAAAILGRRPTWEEAAQAFAAAFAATFHLALQPGDLSPAEQQRAEHLHQSVYANPAWTERVP